MSDTRKRPVPMTAQRQATFLDQLCAGKTVIEAAERAKMDRTAFYRLRADNDEFREAWDEALDHGADLLEAEAQRRAVEGVTDFKVGPNGQFVEMQKYSDTLLIFLLKARRPARFRDNVTVEHTGNPKKPVVVEHQGRLTLSDALALAAQLRPGPNAG